MIEGGGLLDHSLSVKKAREGKSIMEAPLLRHSIVSSALGFLFVLTLTLVAEAKTLYVNGTTGNDATSYLANGENTPWRTIGRAAWGSINRSSPNASEAARAGDTVLIAAGTYSVAGSGLRNDPAYNPANSGTAASPIIFQAQGVVTLTLSSSNGSVIGAYLKNYIFWKGFTINEANAPSHADTGSVTFWDVTGGGAESLVLDGNGDPGFGDNHTGIRIERTTGIVIRNNRIRNYRTSVVNAYNGAGIQNYDSDDILVEYNDISNCGSGIFWKIIGRNIASNAPDTIRYNYLHDNMTGFVDNHHDHLGNPNVHLIFSQNVITNSTLAGIRLIGLATGPTNARIVNNTLHGNANGIYFSGQVILAGNNGLIQNNLITTTQSRVIQNESGTINFNLDRFQFVRNWYYNYLDFLWDVSSTRTLTSFQSTYSGQDLNSTDSTNPQYVDASSGNFRLQAGSPALTAGRVVHSIGGTNGATIPVGAYITGNETIGFNASLSGGGSNPDITPPLAVQNLRLINP